MRYPVCKTSLTAGTSSAICFFESGSEPGYSWMGHTEATLSNFRAWCTPEGTEVEVERRTGLKIGEVTAALASYVRTIRSGDSRFDRYAAGKASALSELEKAGLAVFCGRAACFTCHIGLNFTDEKFHNTGVAFLNVMPDGRLVDEGAGDGKFKTPTLREVARTGPYMHDGSFKTLEDVVDYCSEGGRPNPNLDPQIQPWHFRPEEKRALVAFLRSLTGRVREGM
jgi:cytochrome c peroxidase